MSGSNDDHCRGRQFMEAGDLAPLVAKFTHRLSQDGYAELSVRAYDEAARHLAHWLAEARIAVDDIDEAVVDRFARHRCRCAGGRRTKQLSGEYVRRARRFVVFLVECGIVRHKVKHAAPAPDRRVVEFQDWLRRHRGLSVKTRHCFAAPRRSRLAAGHGIGWRQGSTRDAIAARQKPCALRNCT